MGAGWSLEQAWVFENGAPVWRQGPQVGIAIPACWAGKDGVPNFTIVEAVACWEATSAILQAVIKGAILLTPHCLVERQGRLREFRFQDFQ